MITIFNMALLPNSATMGYCSSFDTGSLNCCNSMHQMSITVCLIMLEDFQNSKAESVLLLFQRLIVHLMCSSLWELHCMLTPVSNNVMFSQYRKDDWMRCSNMGTIIYVKSGAVSFSESKHIPLPKKNHKIENVD